MNGRICHFYEPMHDALLITGGLTKDPVIILVIRVIALKHFQKFEKVKKMVRHFKI